MAPTQLGATRPGVQKPEDLLTGGLSNQALDRPLAFVKPPANTDDFEATADAIGRFLGPA
mgnify:CR=1 FL=1